MITIFLLSLFTLILDDNWVIKVTKLDSITFIIIIIIFIVIFIKSIILLY